MLQTNEPRAVQLEANKPPYIERARERIKLLYQQACQPDVDVRDLLEQSFEEIALFFELLDSLETMHTLSVETALTQSDEQAQALRHYQSLFQEAPQAYVVTGLDGTIRQANVAAEQLFAESQRRLVGRSIANFVPNGQRRPFRAALADLREAKTDLLMLRQYIQCNDGTLCEAQLWIGIQRAPSGRPQALRIIVQPMRMSLQDTGVVLTNDSNTDISGVDFAHLFTLVGDITGILAESGDTAQTLNQLAHHLVPLLGDGCILDVELPDGRNVRLVAAADVPHDSTDAMATSEPHDGSQAFDVDQVLEPLPHRDTLRALVSSLTPTSAMVVPIVVEGNICGSLTIVASSRERRLGTVEQTAIEYVARRISEALQGKSGQMLHPQTEHSSTY